MKRIVEIIQRDSKVYTAAQFGLDLTISEALLEYFDIVCFFDEHSEWSWRADPQHENADTFLWDNVQELWDHLEYQKLQFDLVYIHSRGTPDLRRDLFHNRIMNRTRFIITHPSAITFPSTGYKRLNFTIGEEDYKLFYLDIVEETFKKEFLRKTETC